MTTLMTAMVPMKKNKIDPSEKFGIHIRLPLDKYVHVSRLAQLPPKSSIQKIIESFFPKDWQKKESALRSKFQKQGHQDREFYPSLLLRRMGKKKPKMGRPSHI